MTLRICSTVQFIKKKIKVYFYNIKMLQTLWKFFFVLTSRLDVISLMLQNYIFFVEESCLHWTELSCSFLNLGRIPSAVNWLPYDHRRLPQGFTHTDNSHSESTAAHSTPSIDQWSINAILISGVLPVTADENRLIRLLRDRRVLVYFY